MEQRDTAEWYTAFANEQAHGFSPSYEEVSGSIAEDRELLALIDELPPPKRQPHLVLAAVRWTGGPLGAPADGGDGADGGDERDGGDPSGTQPYRGYATFRSWIIDNWPRVRAAALDHRVQTNEPGRCAAIAPALALLPQPLALIEVGASAGLCLYPDRYRYRYDDHAPVGPADSPITIDCRTYNSVPVPQAPPQVAWRAGVDLNPLDVCDDEETRWLECLVWPERTERLQRLRSAVGLARREPPRLVQGDLLDSIRSVVEQAPAGTTPVVIHTAVVSYLPLERRVAFAETMRELRAEGCHWAPNEAPWVFPSIQERLPERFDLPEGTEDAGMVRFVLSLDERPLAYTRPHGQEVIGLAEDWTSGLAAAGAH